MLRRELGSMKFPARWASAMLLLQVATKVCRLGAFRAQKTEETGGVEQQAQG